MLSLDRHHLVKATMRVLQLLPLPASLLQTAFRALLLAAGSRPPEAALRCLFAMETDLAGMLDIAAQTYDGSVHPKHRLTGYHQFFISRLRPNERVLDIGCGNGALAYDLAVHSGTQITGIDIEPVNIAYAQRHYAHPNLRFVLGDARESLPGKHFETVILSNVLEHLHDRPEFLRTVILHCRPRRLLIRLPMLTRHWTVPLRRELGLYYYSDRTHTTEYSTESFVAEMARAELRILHLQINWGELWAEVTPELVPTPRTDV